MAYDAAPKQSHSSGWIAQVWIAFGISVAAATVGIFYLPVDTWIRAFLGMSFVMAVSSSISLSKTLRDIHETDRLVNKIDEAKVNKLLHDSPAQF